MNTSEKTFLDFFRVVIRPETYLNLLYLLLSFPLGIFYFVFLVVGLSLGISLTILWVGLVILLAVFAGWYGLIAFERQMAIGLLRVDIPPMASQGLSGKTLWQKFTTTLSNPVTWKGLFYLFAKFPLGIISFVLLVTLLATSVTLIAAPIYYEVLPPSIGSLTINGQNIHSFWLIDTLSEAIIASLAGMLIGVASLHALNGLAWVSGQFARIMLGNPAPVVTDNGTDSGADSGFENGFNGLEEGTALT